MNRQKVEGQASNLQQYSRVTHLPITCSEEYKNHLNRTSILTTRCTKPVVRYINRICKYFGYSKDEDHLLFDSLVLSWFLHGIKIWHFRANILNVQINFSCGLIGSILQIIYLRYQRPGLQAVGNLSQALSELLPRKRQDPFKYVVTILYVLQSKRNAEKNFIDRCFLKFI